ncbi:uncharacterized protein J2Z40_000191 [Cytobacillus eiseniae]|uniref:Radical SAM core domain-containing protein n=1 Tax=Cytobacillus eiseniae TaxID=762947 RepID=A0ABS4R9R2_9BACI|nr:radical SAM protein [Cytobacillus eiseniae]MBP2239638.1 uncharacterized protein [Cytobacillus eiseniae]
MQDKNTYVPSRFNVLSQTDDHGLVLYNSYNGAICYFTDTEKEEVIASLKRSGVENLSTEIKKELFENGFLISNRIDENRRAQFLHQSLHRTDVMHLVLLPTEACNFRCTYCYESFPRGKMNVETKSGLKALVKEKAATLANLNISWFGGEPLLALDVIEELSTSFLTTASNQKLQYSADLVTNGYYLTKDVFLKLLSWEIRQLMITIDGIGEVHDSRRHLAGGGKTFDKIIENLKAVKEVPGEFNITIRVNFDESNLQETSKLIEFLADEFAEDKRFGVFFRPVGRWGGENDDELPVCSQITSNRKIWEFSDEALTKGMSMSPMISDSLMPTASVCYAAKPHSLVVGANGQLYKCTISMDEEVNQVGKLFENGSLMLDYDKMAAWTTSGEETDSVCQSCFYRPVCQGNHCPLYRMRTGERPCPFEKRKIKKVLNLIWKNSLH